MLLIPPWPALIVFMRDYSYYILLVLLFWRMFAFTKVHEPEAWLTVWCWDSFRTLQKGLPASHNWMLRRYLKLTLTLISYMCFTSAPTHFFLPSFVYLYCFSIMFSRAPCYPDDHMYKLLWHAIPFPRSFTSFSSLISQESSQIPIQNTASHSFIAFCSLRLHSPIRNPLSIIQNMTL